MLAAPTSEKDFQLLFAIRSLSWKQRILYLEELALEVSHYPSPLHIEICFLQLLQQKNINVLARIFKLIMVYVKIYGIKILNLKEIISSIVRSSQSQTHIAHQILICIFEKSVHSLQYISKILQGLAEFSNSSIWAQVVLKFINFLVSSKFHNDLFKISDFQKCISNCFFHVSSIPEQVYEEFFVRVVKITGSNAILFGRRLKLSSTFINLIKEQVKHIIEDRHDQVEIEYKYDISSRQWLQDYKFISLKPIILSLKQTVNQIRNGQFFQMNGMMLETLKQLLLKKVKTVNKYIFQILTETISRSQVAQDIQTYQQVLLHSIGDKRVYRKLTQPYLAIKQQLWLSIITESFIQNQIILQNSQQMYHRILALLTISNLKSLFDIKIVCKKLLSKDNLSSIYRIKLQNFLK